MRKDIVSIKMQSCILNLSSSWEMQKQAL